jgi:SAM-dependent methyltransferase
LNSFERTSFPIKSSLDIGVGDGKYLKYLRDRGFRITGIDSSETAVSIARRNLGKDAALAVADMYEYDIARNEYDFIFSIATIHHGLKEQIESLIARIHEALVPGGSIFVTLPVWDAKDKWKSLKTYTEIAPGTIATLSGPEKRLAHSIYTESEVGTLFARLGNLSVSEDDRQRWIVTAAKSARAQAS